MLFHFWCCESTSLYLQWRYLAYIFINMTLFDLTTVQPLRSTRSSSFVTLARPSTSSSLRITDHSFQHASPCLWNQLPTSVRQPRTNLQYSDSPNRLSDTSSIGSIDSSLFYSRLKTFFFCKSLPPLPPFSSSGLTPLIPRTHYFWEYPFLLFSFSYFVLFSCWSLR